MKNFQIHLSTKFSWILFLGIVLISCVTQNDVSIKFQATVDGEDLEYGKSYPSPNGDGTFSINDFKLYISNIKLLQTGNEDLAFVEKESYHLLKFPDGNPFSFELKDVPDVLFDRIQFVIGIDEEANSSIENPGDLDPTNQMAWNWTQGYKFLLLEGLYFPEKSEQSIPLVFHIGFSENAKEVEFELSHQKEIRFRIEINELFLSPNPIDFHDLPTVLFNEEQAAMVAMNYGENFLVRE